MIYTALSIAACLLFSAIALCWTPKMSRGAKLRRAEKLFVIKAAATAARLPEPGEVNRTAALRTSNCDYLALNELQRLTSCYRAFITRLEAGEAMDARLTLWEEQLSAYASASRLVSKDGLLYTLKHW